MTTLDRTAAHPTSHAVHHGAAGPAGDVIANLARGSSNASFAGRHIGPTAEDEQIMLRELGYSDLDTLIAAAVPSAVRSTTELALPPAVSEATALGELQQLAAANDPGEAMIGLGYHSTVTPPVIRRNVLENPAWYTSYTPYQPEISQGRLEALLNFQTMIGELTGLPTANASLLDEATAVVEGVLLMRRAAAGDRRTVFVDVECLPQTIAVLKTRCAPLGLNVIVGDPNHGMPNSPCTADQPEGGRPKDDLFGIVLQYPAASGAVAAYADLAAEAHARGALVTVAADPLALTILVPPGQWGADVVVGSSQRFGVPLFYGGPHAGFIAVRGGLERNLPGRLVGVSEDADGAPAYRLALQTREQHIRRDKATSNICTAQVLLAITASMYAVYHGPDGLRHIAWGVHRKAAALAGCLRAAGLALAHDCYFDTLTVEVPHRAERIVEAAAIRGVHLRQIDAHRVGISCGENTTAAHLDSVAKAFDVKDGLDDAARAILESEGPLPGLIPVDLLRGRSFLTHPTFTSYHSETALLRYLRRLADQDYALDRGMIPLGSCTMKLNATSEMEPISLAGFANLHPFVPASAASGYRVLIEQLEDWLAHVTGYAKVSVQPNAGSQGELAGLLAIRAYHQRNSQSRRNICLIPASAHGTNAASAVLAGLQVVSVRSRPDGTIDLDDLTTKCAQYVDQLAAIMITYPSTHGVYEEDITEVCDLVHAHGGQVYVDGANLNALLGLAAPGNFGGDVSHLNLHKTFCIPHGGGGPGVGPIAVAAHLAPFLPTHPDHPNPQHRDGVGPVSAAPFGSAGILPITWAYIRMMSGAGLQAATRTAVLAANYVAARLGAHYPLLYTGNHGLVAHECILDLRPLTKVSGVTVDDVAKRLIDYGFHAPTVSFPVGGTLMIEPTESENLTEIDRFIDAMIAIRHEIEAIIAGEQELTTSQLRRAPHTARSLTEHWDRPYSRAVAVFPTGGHRFKYWPPVTRIDQARGDKNLVCSCPPITAYDSDDQHV